MDKSKFQKGSDSKLHFDNRFMENPVTYDDIILYQVGDWFMESGSEIEEHIQNCYEITLVISGKGTFWVDHKEYTLNSGDIFIGLPGEIHSGKADLITPFRFFYLGFDFTKYIEKSNPLRNIQQTFDNKVNPHAVSRLNLEQPFINIFEEMIGYNEYATEMISMYLKQILILTYRSLIGNHVSIYSPKNEIDENKQIVYKIINYIECNVENITNLSKIAEKLGYSYYYLSHLFTKETGKTMQEFYNETKIQKAKDWIEKDQLSITEIAEKLNYSSIHSFSRVFKKETGLAPAKYRDNIRNQTENNEKGRKVK